MLDLLDDIIKKACKNGADQAEAVLFDSISLSVDRRLGKQEGLEQAESKDLGLRVFVGNSQAIVSTTDFTQNNLDQAIEQAIAMARAVPEDPFSGLANTDLIAKDITDLDLCDKAEPPDVETLTEQAQRAEDAAMAVDGITNSDGAACHWDSTSVYLCTSHGFSGSYTRTGHSLSVSVVGGEGANMERDYDYASRIYQSDMPPPETVGQCAAERTVARLNSKQGKSGKMPVIYAPRVANSLLRHLSKAISGSAIARGTSFLKNHLGQNIFPDHISIIDNGTITRGMRSSPFDGEGVAHQKHAFIDQGVLTNWIMDSRSAKKLGLTTTGNASRGTSGPPSPSVSNFYMEAGTTSPEELITDIKEGFYITEFMGSTVSLITGDYSRGASGFWIENGQIAYPISEMTVAGNLKDMFMQITPANDLELRYGIDAPTLRVDGMTVAGA